MHHDLARRSSVYLLLARLWRREVDAPLLGRLRGPLGEAYRAAGGSLPDETDEAGTLERLAIDYCGLFLGPSGHLPPCQSVWVQGQFQSRCVDSMRAYLELLLDDSLARSAPFLDHFGVQLEFLGRVLAQASLQEASRELDALADLARRFFCDHLAWASPLLAAVEARAQTDFYRGLARFTSGFLATEQPLLRRDDTCRTTSAP